MIELYTLSKYIVSKPVTELHEEIDTVIKKLLDEGNSETMIKTFTFLYLEEFRKRENAENRQHFITSLDAPLGTDGKSSRHDFYASKSSTDEEAISHILPENMHVISAFRVLPDSMRAVLEAVVLDGISFQEVAKTTGENILAIEKLYNDGITMMRKTLTNVAYSR
ncbi:hypothetical protein BH11PAT1_BH11PAT1_6730 [soil metagenome]